MTVQGPDRYRGARSGLGVPAAPGQGQMRRSVVALVVTGVALVLAAVLVRGFVGTDVAQAAAADEGTVQTRWGPLTAVERDLVVRVRLAGLWEAPSGEQAQQLAGSDAVRDVGRRLMTEHFTLDEAVRAVAGQLGVALPNEPNADQKGWMAELSQLQGDAYDRRFVHLLRVAHGKIFSVLAGVRGSTQNSVMRSFVATGIQYVSRHMGYLESTGMADWNAVSAAVAAPPAPATTKVSATSSWPAGFADKAILIALLLAGAVNFLIFRRSRRRWADSV